MLKQLDLFAQLPSRDGMLPTPTFPFRTVLKEADDAAIRTANEKYAPKGVARMEPAEVAMRRIESTKSPAPSRLLSWALHPDERVRVALLRSPLITPNRNSTLFAAALIWSEAARTLARAADGHTLIELWNPVFDAIHEKGIEINRFSRFGVLREYSITLDYNHPLPTDNFAPLTAWMKTATDPEWLDTVLRSFRSTKFLDCIATMATTFDLERVKLLLDLWPTLAPSLARNNSIYARADSPAIIASLKRWAMEAIINVRELARHPHVNLADLYYTPGARVLLHLEGIGQGLSLDDHRYLAKGLSSIPDSDREHMVLSPHYQASRFYNDSLLNLPVDTLEIVIPALVANLRLFYRIPELLDRDDLTSELAHTVAQHYDTERIRAKLASQPRWRRDPTIRARLLASTAAGVVVHMLRDANAEEFARIFRRAATRHPDIAAEVLEERLDDVGGVLTKSDLVPLLTSASSKARLVAIQAISQATASPRRRTLTR